MENEQNENNVDAKPLISVTNHAYDRAKQRLSWKNNVLYKMAEKAYLEGIKHSDTKGTLNRYITKLFMEHKTANNIRIYGENIFFFSHNILITIYQLPNNVKKKLR